MPSAADRAQAFLDEAGAAFARAAEGAGGAVVENRVLAGRTIRFEIAGSAMGRMLRAFLGRTAAPTAEPELTLRVWDSETSGTPPLKAPWALTEYGHYGLIPGFNDARFFAGLQFAPLILSMLDLERRSGICWTQSAGALSIHDWGAPMRPLIGEWLRRHDILPMHAGAVGLGEDGVLLAGAKGRGKSNTALACLADGFAYASDDFCAVSRDEAAGWRMHGLFATGKLSASDLARHPALQGLASNPHADEADKRLFYLGNRFADRLSAGFRLRAIVLPRVRPGEPTRLVSVGPAEAQRGVAMNNMEMSPRVAGETFRRVAELVRAVPSWELCVGDESERVPALIRGLLQRKGSAGQV